MCTGQFLDRGSKKGVLKFPCRLQAFVRDKVEHARGPALAQSGRPVKE